MKIAVYTCITGKYDNLPNIVDAEIGIDYICFTDTLDYYAKNNTDNIWQMKSVYFKGSATDCNRAIKILPHYFISPEYDYTVYIDGYIDIVGSVKQLIADNKDLKIATYDHSFRKTLFEEYVACALSGHVSIGHAKKQFKHMLDSGYIENCNLQECSVIIRKHFDPDVTNFSNIWWNLYFLGIKRDQLSFDFSLQRAKLSRHNLGESDPRVKNLIFKHRINHESTTKITRRILSFVNRVIYKIYPDVFLVGKQSSRFLLISEGMVALMDRENNNYI
jgi:hypothetical protein